MREPKYRSKLTVRLAYKLGYKDGWMARLHYDEYLAAEYKASRKARKSGKR
jgi:hypothetical protein